LIQNAVAARETNVTQAVVVGIALHVKGVTLQRIGYRGGDRCQVVGADVGQVFPVVREIRAREAVSVVGFQLQRVESRHVVLQIGQRHLRTEAGDVVFEKEEN